MNNYYDILGITKDSTPEEIQIFSNSFLGEGKEGGTIITQKT